MRRMKSLRLSSDELEVACDALWFVKGRGGLDAAGQALWDRLQPLRHGDYGGLGSVNLTGQEAQGVGAALERVESGVGMDDHERALSRRIEAGPTADEAQTSSQAVT